MISKLFEKKRFELFLIFPILLSFLFWKSIINFQEKEKIFFTFSSIFSLACLIFYKEKLLTSSYFIFFVFFWMLVFKFSFFDLNFSISLIFLYLAWIFFFKKGFLLTDQKNFFDGCFFIGLSGIFYPPSFLYLLWPLIGIGFEKKTYLKKILSCLLGFLSPLWAYFLGAYIFFHTHEAFFRFEKLYKISYPSFDLNFYIFFLLSIFFLFAFFSKLGSSKGQNILLRSKLQMYDLNVLIGIFQVIFFSSQKKSYAFLMIPFCFYFSRYLEYQKKYWLKELLIYFFIFLIIFIYFFEDLLKFIPFF